MRACSWLATLLVPCAAVAAPRADLTVERSHGAEDCPDAAALEAMLARIMSSPQGASGGDAAVQASVAFGRSAVGYAAELRVRGGKDGERTLTDTGPTCTALGRAVGITLALILDAYDELAPAPALVVASPPPAPVVAPASPTRAGVLSATLGPAFGLVGKPTLAGGLELDVRLARRLIVEAGGQLAAPRSTTFDTGSVEVGLAVALVGVCGVLADPDASVMVAACARGVAGQLRGAGSGFASSSGATLGWWGAGGGLEVRGVVGRRWLLGASADVVAPLRRDTFSVGNRGVAYGSDAVAAMLRLGIGWRLW